MYETMFTLLDHRGSNKLEISALRMFIESLPDESYIPVSEAEKLFHEYDTDKSGDIDADEFFGLCQAISKEIGMPVKAMAKHFKSVEYHRLFMMVDDQGNSDNTISAFELQTFLDAVKECGLHGKEGNEDPSVIIRKELAASSEARAVSPVSSSPLGGGGASFSSASRAVLNFEEFCNVVDKILEGTSVSRALTVFQEATRKRRVRRSTVLSRFAKGGNDDSSTAATLGRSHTVSSFPPPANPSAAAAAAIDAISKEEHEKVKQKLAAVEKQLKEETAKSKSLEDKTDKLKEELEAALLAQSVLRMEMEERREREEVASNTGTAPIAVRPKPQEDDAAKPAPKTSSLVEHDVDDDSPPPQLVATLRGFDSLEKTWGAQGEAHGESLHDVLAELKPRDDDDGASPVRVHGPFPAVDEQVAKIDVFAANLQEQLKQESIAAQRAAHGGGDSFTPRRDEMKHKITIPPPAVERHHRDRMEGWILSIEGIANKLISQVQTLERFFERITMSNTVMVQLQESALGDTVRLASLQKQRKADGHTSRRSDEEEDIITSLEVFLDSMELKRNTIGSKVAVCDGMLRDTILPDMAKLRQQILLYLEQYEWIRFHLATLIYHGRCGTPTEVDETFNANEFAPSTLATQLVAVGQLLASQISKLNKCSGILFSVVDESDVEKVVRAAIVDKDAGAIKVAKIVPRLQADLSKFVNFVDNNATEEALWFPLTDGLKSVSETVTHESVNLLKELDAAPRVLQVADDGPAASHTDSHRSGRSPVPFPALEGLVDDAQLGMKPIVPTVEAGVQADLLPDPLADDYMLPTDVTTLEEGTMTVEDPGHDEEFEEIPMDPHSRLVRFLEHHNPDKLPSVDKILASYSGRESALFSALVAKYGPEPQPERKLKPRAGQPGNALPRDVAHVPVSSNPSIASSQQQQPTSNTTGGEAGPNDAKRIMAEAERLDATTSALMLPVQSAALRANEDAIRMAIYKDILASKKEKFMSDKAAAASSNNDGTVHSDPLAMDLGSPGPKSPGTQDEGATNPSITRESLSNTSFLTAGPAFMSGVENADSVKQLRRYIEQLEVQTYSLQSSVESSKKREEQMRNMLDVYHTKLQELQGTDQSTSVSLRMQLENARRHAVLLEQRLDELEDENVALVRKLGRTASSMPGTLIGSQRGLSVESGHSSPPPRRL